MTINDQIINELLLRGLSSIQGAFYNTVDYWRQWYQSLVPEFHLYNVTLADGTTVQKERLTMNFAKKICEDMAKLLWSNKVQINLDTPENTEKLHEILKQNNFKYMFPRQLELCAALGTVAFIEYMNDKGKVVIEYIGEADRIIPFEYSADSITGFLTVSRFTKIERNTIIYYTHLTFHEFVDNSYIRYNMVYRSPINTELGEEIVFTQMFPEIEQKVIIPNVEYPYFQILKLPIVNNYDLNNPLGLSIFGNSIDRLKSLDMIFDSLYNEFITGKKRILIDYSALKNAPEVVEGNVVNNVYFDKNDTTYVAIRGMEQQPIKDIDFNLRYQEHIQSIQAELNWLSSNIGFGENFYKFDGSQPMTATEVIANDSDAYRTKENYDVVVKECVENLVKAICQLAGIQTSSVEVITDFSRFKNDSAEQQRLMQEVNNGITSKIEYRMKIYNEDEITARKKIESINLESPPLEQLMVE